MKLELHWKIIIGLLLGLLYGIFAASQGLTSFTSEWIAPFGKIFLNLLKLIAVPLVLSSLITGVASLSDTKKLSRIGGKTITIYVVTTAIAVTIGLISVNILQPGNTVPEDMKTKLQETYKSAASGRMEAAAEVKDRSVLQPLVDNIMLIAPIGVFALISDTITSVAGDNLNNILELLSALGYYMLAVIIGLILQMVITYTTVLKLFSKMSLKTFYQGIAPAQLLAFSTSSSGATLPVTMERCEEELGVSEEVSSFVLPLGATINMDGTALYQAVAAVFIAQTIGMDLALGAQLTIVFTAVLASIGTAAVPGAGIIMLIIILEAVGVPSAGIALILGVDRILDMMRTVTNVTGDASVAVTVHSSEIK